MKTGRYRVRRSMFGRAILQAETDCPSYIGGQIDSSIRMRECANGRMSRSSKYRISCFKSFRPPVGPKARALLPACMVLPQLGPLVCRYVALTSRAAAHL